MSHCKALMLACADGRFKPQSEGHKITSRQPILGQSRSWAEPRNGSTVVVPRMSFWHVRPQSCTPTPPNQTAICHLPFASVRCAMHRREDIGTAPSHFVQVLYGSDCFLWRSYARVAPPLCP